MLDALTNLAQALQGDPGEWEKGSPVGITVGTEELLEEEQLLVNTYHSLDVPVEGTLPEGMPTLVSVDQALIILFGKSKSKAVSSELPDENELADNDDDALNYTRIQLDHDAQGLNTSGRHKTNVEIREDKEDAFVHKYAAECEEAATARKEATAMAVWSPCGPHTTIYSSSQKQRALWNLGPASVPW